MTNWGRVSKLRARGASWNEVAADDKVDFHPPEGAEAGRALKVLYYRRKAETGAGRTPSPADQESGRARLIDGVSRRRIAMIGSGVSAFAVAILFLAFLPSSFGPVPAPSTNPGPGAAGSMVEFNYLSQQHSDACHWPGVNLGDETANIDWVNGLTDGTFLQGACCSPMDFSDYSNQTAGLRAYASLSAIVAPDPNNMPSRVAKAEVAGEQVVLSASQEVTLSSAASQTNDQGWCCCQCWAYYAHEGLAKILVAQYGYDAQQTASVINLEDCCGGPGPMSM